MVSRVYVEKKPGFDVEAQHLLHELRSILGLGALNAVRLFNRYDVEGIDEELFRACVPTVFSEPQSDTATDELPAMDGAAVFAVEYLPGQFDQRAESASECVQLISQGERPAVRSATVYALFGELSDEDIAAVKHYVINPVEAREASLDARDTLALDTPEPAPVEVIDGFIELDAEGLQRFIDERGLAMDLADIEFFQKYFQDEGRNPTITEVKVVDTYWSDHCRHTTFGTVLDEVAIDDAVVQAAFDKYMDMRHELGRDEKPVCLMDMGTIGAKYLKSKGILKNLDESDEITACTAKVKVDVDGQDEDWLFLFKNETHNHPTEIEPFGGAATCVGGAIRDPLSGRSYVYQAMRVTGAANPLAPVSETIPGKLPQRKIVTEAAAGYSSYGNQIGLATGQVSEIYHPGYAAKRMEVGVVLGAAPAANVRREEPAPGDVVVLLGGRTGRDGIGGATGSSKAQNVSSVEECGAEVQKGNAPVERKLQRLFRRGDACRLIKRCNDFGAGGVSVAIGELCDGLQVNLDAVPKKYDGLDGTELAIAESQERMAVALAAADVEEFLGYAREENLEATVVAQVTEEPRVRMMWRGSTIVDLSREFLASNGAPKHQKVHVAAAASGKVPTAPHTEGQGEILAAPGAMEDTLDAAMHALVTDLNVCSNKGLVERFDSTIGAATVLMPFGGIRQLTPAQAMVAKFPVFGETRTVSGMAWGFNPYVTEKDQFTGAYLSVVESVAKLVATGFSHEKVYLSFQEYFEKLRDEPERWGKPVAAVLGALMAQVDLGVGAIGGKDSMSGSFEDLDVPPTLISFAVATGDVDHIVSPEFKGAGNRVVRIMPAYRGAEEHDDMKAALPNPESLAQAFRLVEELISSGSALAVSTSGFGGAAEALFKMCVGNGIGIKLADTCSDADMDMILRAHGMDSNDAEARARVEQLAALYARIELFTLGYGTFFVELAEGAEVPEAACGVDVRVVGETTEEYVFAQNGESVDLADLQEAWERPLESVFPYRDSAEEAAAKPAVEPVTWMERKPLMLSATVAKPKVIIPVFPGTNCEYDTAAAFERAGAEAQVLVINNLTPASVHESVEALARGIRESQIVMLPGGFSGGDEPDGSAKFITAFFRAPEVTEAVRDLLQNRDGLMLGICNGFQALIKLGLVPFGDIRPMDADCPTLTFNNIGRHQSGLVNTRVASSLSPWLSRCEVGDVHTIAISHGEGRFVANDEVLAQMKANGQIATQYVDAAGMPSMSLGVNPNGSVWAIEGITSPDGRVLGKMGHTERSGYGLYKNVPGDKYQLLFEGGVDYFTL